MAYEFTKLSEVELLESVPDNASAFVEVGGTVKRVPGSGLGGGGIKTAVVKAPGYDSAVSDVQTNATSIVADEATAPTVVNMTFEEAYGIMASGEPLMSLLMFASSSAPEIVCGNTFFAGDKTFGEPCIVFGFKIGDGLNMNLFWTSSGLSEGRPSGVVG